MIVVLMVGMLILFNVLRGGGCGGGEKPEDVEPAKIADTTTLKPVRLVQPLELENSKIKVRLLGWQTDVGFRIDQVELKDFNRRISADTTGTIPVRLLYSTPIYDRGNRFLATREDSLFDQLVDEAMSQGGIKAPEYAGFQITANVGEWSADTFHTAAINDSTLNLVWTDSLGAQRSIEVMLVDYQVRFHASDTLPGLGGFTFRCPNGIARTEPQDKSEIAAYQIYYRTGDKEIKYLASGKIGNLHKATDKSKEKRAEVQTQRAYEWVTLRGKYFTSIIIPDQPSSGQIFPDLTADRRISLDFKTYQKTGYSVYFGPSDYFLLKNMGHRLSRTVELGGTIYRWLSEAILWLFHWFNMAFNNYGVTIIIFALMVKLIFLPLSRIQQRSMQKMQMLQPKIKELQERFKDDPQRLNQETMNLYRTHKASPFSGCLPLLIQMPVFFGLYAVLRNTIALRGAHFVKLFSATLSKPFYLISEKILRLITLPAGKITWLADLSQHDPFYILPVLMGVASVFQSLRTNLDPRQRMTALIFPILITVIFLNFPSGLQLYWLVFNLLSIIEYSVFRRGGQIGGTQWQKSKQGEIQQISGVGKTRSERSLPRSSRR